MIQLLFALVLAEVGVAVLLLVKTPLRKVVILTLDRLKRGRGPIVVRTVAATGFVVFATAFYSMFKIQRRSVASSGSLTPTDQVLWARHLLEASLMGYSLVLTFVIDRMHHYMKDLRGLRKGMESVIKQNRMLEEAKNGGSEEVRVKDKEIANLKLQIVELQLDSEAREKQARVAEAKVEALRKQSEGFLLEYDRLLEDNQNLRCHLKSIDRKLSHSDSQKIL